MPSRFEPCGTGQMIGTRYGTPTIVRAKGGLRDTVIDETPTPTQAPARLRRRGPEVAVVPACVSTATAPPRGPSGQPFLDRGMSVDFDWRSSSAPAYLAAFRRAIALRTLVSSLRDQERRVRFLLTSGGIKSTSIRDALIDLWASRFPSPVPLHSHRHLPLLVAHRWPTVIAGLAASPLTELGWKSWACSSSRRSPASSAENWVVAVEEADALLVFGGDVLYLCRWMRESGLADLLPSLRETVYVGVRAGSMVTAPIFGETYNDPNTPFVIDKGLGLVDFALLPHLDHENHPEAPRQGGKNGRRGPGDLWIHVQTAIKVSMAGRSVSRTGKRFEP